MTHTKNHDEFKQIVEHPSTSDKETKKNYRPIIFNDSPTLQKLEENMARNYETGIIYEAEPGVWKYRVRSNQDTILLKSYTMEPFRSETITYGSVIMEAPVLTICSYIQPGVADNIYSKKELHDDGLLPRILPVFIPRDKKVKDADPPDVPSDLIKIYENKIKKLLLHSSKENTNE